VPTVATDVECLSALDWICKSERKTIYVVPLFIGGWVYLLAALTFGMPCESEQSFALQVGILAVSYVVCGHTTAVRIEKALNYSMCASGTSSV